MLRRGFLGNIYSTNISIAKIWFLSEIIVIKTEKLIYDKKLKLISWCIFIFTNRLKITFCACQGVKSLIKMNIEKTKKL